MYIPPLDDLFEYDEYTEDSDNTFEVSLGFNIEFMFSQWNNNSFELFIEKIVQNKFSIFTYIDKFFEREFKLEYNDGYFTVPIFDYGRLYTLVKVKNTSILFIRLKNLCEFIKGKNVYNHFE